MLRPTLSFSVFPKHPNIRIHEQARQPRLPRQPLVIGDDGDLIEIMVVCAAEEFDLFPRDIRRVVDHAAQVEYQVGLVAALEFVQRVFFELLEIGEGEVTHDGDVDEVGLVFDGDHLLTSVLVGARRKLNMPLAMTSAIPSHALTLNDSFQNINPNRAENTTVLYARLPTTSVCPVR